MNQPITASSGASSLQLYHPDPCYCNYKASFLSVFFLNQGNMRDIVEWLQEWIMHGLSMNTSDRSFTESHFKWKRLSYYWSHSLNFPGPEGHADSQRASATQRERSYTKDPHTFYFLNEAAARLRGSEDNVMFLHPCTCVRVNCGHHTAGLVTAKCRWGTVRTSLLRLGLGQSQGWEWL